MAGTPTARIIEILNARHGWNVPVEEASHHKESLFVQLIDQIKPIEPVVDVVRQFEGRLPMAVATGATRAILLKTLSAVNLTEKFAALVTADDVQHGKPAPDIFLESARRIGVAPGACLAFEDAELGLQSARAAGMRVIDIRPAYHAARGGKVSKS
jgi:HAD superfamily hydrolase (TIGR01509 family)